MRLRMVDRILWWDAKEGIRGLKAASFEEYSLKEAFGGEARLPELLLLQSAFELAAWFVMLTSRFAEGGVAEGIERVSFPAGVGPGERVLLDLELTAETEQGILLDASGKVGDRDVLVAKGLHVRRMALSSLGDPEDYRTLFSEIGTAGGP